MTAESPAKPINPASRFERRRIRTREALLGAARQLLSYRAVEAVTVDEIAERADVAKGTFYNYFTDKDSLVREVEDVARRELERQIADTNKDVTDAAERMARAFAAVLAWSLADRARARSLARMTPHFADPDASINAGVRRDVHTGVAEGRFKALTDEAGVVLSLSVIAGGLNRALELDSKAKVCALGENLGEALLIALGLERPDASALAKSAMSAIN